MQQQNQQQLPQGRPIGWNVLPNYTLSGMSSFDAESLPDYSEFDSESVTLDYYKERYPSSSKLSNSHLYFVRILFCIRFLLHRTPQSSTTYCCCFPYAVVCPNFACRYVLYSN